MTTPAAPPPPAEPLEPTPRPATYAGGYQVPPQAYQPADPRPAAPPPGGYPPPPFPVSPGGYKLAEFGDRLLAYLIDRLIVGLIAGVLTVPIIVVALLTFLQDRLTDPTTFGPTYDNPNGLPPGPFLLLAFGVFGLTLLITLIVQLVYDVEMMHRSGQTIGKRALKIKVIPVDPSLALTRGMAFKRYLVQFVLAGLIPFLSYLDGFWQLWDQPYRQCLHDKYATTLVIKLDA